MAIDNPVLLQFVNETVRMFGDRLAGLLPLVDQFVAAAKGKGIAEKLGTTTSLLFRAEEWTLQELGGVANEVITDSGSGGRQELTAHDVIIGVMRPIARLKALIDANPEMLIRLGRIAVNPR
jgi:hypothetical protein